MAAPFADLASAASEVKGTAWVHVIDALSGETIYSNNANVARTPASITKILAAVTAQYTLDERATLTTGVSLQDSQVYLWGEGDLLLGTGAPTDEVNGRASLATLAARTAQALTERGVHAVSLNWAPHPFDGPSRLPEWGTQEVGDYEGHVGAYAINSGSIPGTRSFVPDPEKDVADEFAALLENHGVTVTLGSQSAAPETATELARVQSATIGEQIRYMLYQSDNTMADQLCRLAAAAAGKEASYSGAAQTVENTLQSMGVNPTDLTLHDCSGLSSLDRILPETLTSVLRASMISDRADLRDLVRNLPWAGAQGTMSRRYYDGPAIGNVQGKTGSLGHVSSLAGNVRTSTGRELIFAVGIEGTEEGQAYSLRPAVDTFIQTLSTL